MQQDFVQDNPPMPMLCELTTVLQYMVAIAESMALPPSNITFLHSGSKFYSDKCIFEALFYSYFQYIPPNLLSDLCTRYGVNRNSCILVDTQTRIARARVNLAHRSTIFFCHLGCEIKMIGTNTQ